MIHQLRRVGMALLSLGLPPSADGTNGKARRVVISADADPSGIVANVVDAVGHGAGKFGIDEIVNVRGATSGRCS